jgi:hypothetical protein
MYLIEGAKKNILGALSLRIMPWLLQTTPYFCGLQRGLLEPCHGRLGGWCQFLDVAMVASEQDVVCSSPAMVASEQDVVCSSPAMVASEDGVVELSRFAAAP